MIPHEVWDLFDGTGNCRACGALIPAGLWIYDLKWNYVESGALHHQWHQKLGR